MQQDGWHAALLGLQQLPQPLLTTSVLRCNSAASGVCAKRSGAAWQCRCGGLCCRCIRGIISEWDGRMLLLLLLLLLPLSVDRCWVVALILW